MKTLWRSGLLLVLALFASAAVASSAQALAIHPNDTDVNGVAGPLANPGDPRPTLSYGSAVVECDNGTASGRTGVDSDNVDLALGFDTNCNVAGIPAVVTCTGTAKLTALTASPNATGTIDLNPGFRCDIVVDETLCTISVVGPQDTGSVGTIDESADTLSADVDVAATRTGSALCGPASGTGNFTGLYHTTPANLVVDP